MLGLNQVAQLRADVNDGTLRVLAGDQLIPNLALCGRGDQGQLESGQVPGASGDGLRGGQRLVQPARAAVAAAAAMARRRQLDATLPMQVAQGFVATGRLRLAETVEEAEFAADVAGECAPAGAADLCQQHLQGRHGLCGGESLGNAMLVEHVSDMPQRP